MNCRLSVMAVAACAVLTSCQSNQPVVEAPRAEEALDDSLFSKRELLLRGGAPEIVLRLAEWPREDVVERRRVDWAQVGEVARGAKDFWMKEVFDPAWRPGSDAEVLYLRREVEGRDVVRTRWQMEGYTMEVSQTRSLFVLQVTPPRRIDDFRVTGFARDMFLRMFPKERTSDHTPMYQWRPQNIAEVAVVSVLYDWDVLGRDLFVAQLVSPETGPVYTKDWFLVLGCWNDGEHLVTYFEKPRGGAREFARADFASLADRGWFLEE